VSPIVPVQSGDRVDVLVGGVGCAHDQHRAAGQRVAHGAAGDHVVELVGRGQSLVERPGPVVEDADLPLQAALVVAQARKRGVRQRSGTQDDTDRQREEHRR